jgi:hypothetical protein
MHSSKLLHSSHYDAINPSASDILFSTLLNTLNRSKSVIYVPDLCRAATKVRWNLTDVLYATG